LPESFQTTAKISRVGYAHPDFFQGGRLPTLLPPCRRPCVKYLSFSINDACRCIRCQVFRWAATQLAKGHEKWVWGRGVPIALGVGLLLEEKFAKMNENGAFQCILKRLAVYKTSIKHRLT